MCLICRSIQISLVQTRKKTETFFVDRILFYITLENKEVMESKEAAGWQETNQNKLWKKIKQDPFVPLGVFGCIGAILYGYYNHKNKGNISTSTYLMKLRVKAQGMVVGAIALGVIWGMYKEHQAKKEKGTIK